MYVFDAIDGLGKFCGVQVTLQEIFHGLLVDFLIGLRIIFIQFSDVLPLRQHLNPKILGRAVHPRVGLFLPLLQLYVEGHFHGVESAGEEVVDAVGRVGELYVVGAVADPG